MPRLHRWASTATPSTCGKATVEAATASVAGTGVSEVVGETWSSVSILDAFHVTAAAASGGDAAARVQEMSTAALAANVSCVLRAAHLPLPGGKAGSDGSADTRTATRMTAAVDTLLLRLRDLAETHERFVAWMATWSPSLLDATTASVEDAFLSAAATYLHAAPRSATAAEMLPGSYAQVLSTNLYAISSVIHEAPSPHPSQLPPPPPREVAALSLLYHLAVLTLDVIESSLRCCWPIHETARGRSPAPTVGPAAVAATASPAAPLCLTLRTLRQQEGSHLLGCLLQCGRLHNRCASSGVVAALDDDTHRRLLTRHVLRRLGPLLFRPLHTVVVCAGQAKVSTTTSDRTDDAITAWMAARLRRMIPVTPRAPEHTAPWRGGGADSTEEADHNDGSGGLLPFEVECLAELLRSLSDAVDGAVSPLPAAASTGCCGDGGDMPRTAEVVNASDRVFSRLPVHLECLRVALPAASLCGEAEGEPVASTSMAEALRAARALVLQSSGAWRHAPSHTLAHV
ncbi:hypothetical protein NESM_000094700 [Novymonas esmeraldas]|uniref:Uncharacterized protein n=1 Tax=Novymonas esmeraldas TaxID=1808958 RepID=A0AAW0F430_9TRYP